MNKVILFLLLFITLACNKEPEYQVVTFGYSLVEEHSMTKTINHSAINEVISSAIPATIKPAFYFNHDETQGANVTIGETTQMKIGEYHVKWNNIPTSIAEVINDKTSFSKTPLLDIDTDLTVVPGTTEYTLPVTFKSFAIVVDAMEVSKVEYSNLASSFVDIDFFITSGDNMLIFVNGEFTDNGVIALKLYPANDYYKFTSLYLSNKVATVGQKSTIHVDYGKYYILHPEAVTEVGSLFNLNIPEWEWGNEEN